MGTGGGDGGGGGGGGMMMDGGGGGGGMGTGVGNETLICRKTTTTGTEGKACTATDPTTCAAGYSWRWASRNQRALSSARE